MDSHHPLHGQAAAPPPNANPDNEVDLTLKLGLPSDGKETVSSDYDAQNVNPAPINICLANFHFTGLYGTQKQGVKAYGPSSGGGHICLNHHGLMVSPGMKTSSLTNQAGNVHAGFVLGGGSSSCNHQVVQNWGAGAGHSQMPVAAAWPPAGMGNLLHGSMTSSGVGVQLMNQGIASSLVGIIPAQAAAKNYANHPHTNFNNVVGLTATLIKDLNPPGFPPARVMGINAHQGDDEGAEEGDDEESEEGDEIEEGGNSDGENRRTCTHCNKSKTPMWRRGPFGPKTLCNACGIKYRKEQERKRAREAAKQSDAQSSNAPSLG